MIFIEIIKLLRTYHYTIDATAYPIIIISKHNDVVSKQTIEKILNNVNNIDIVQYGVLVIISVKEKIENN